MDSFEWNKIAGWTLAAILLVLVIRTGVETLYETHTPETAAYPIAVPESAGGGEEMAEEAQQGPSLAVLLASANASAGEAAFKKCTACHTIEAGGPNRTGPNLHNIVGADIAHHGNFGYSSDLANAEGVWTYERLDTFLASPRSIYPGTKMSFAGVRREAERADLIAYLRANTENPPALPQDAAAAEAAPAEEAASPVEDATEAN